MRLFLPAAGNKVAHVRAFQAVPEVECVVISDIFPWAMGNFVADRAYRLPPFTDHAFMPAVKRLLEKERIDVCLPLHDAALALFDSHRRELAELADLGVRLGMASPETIAVCADKVATHELFRRIGLPVPDSYTFDRFLESSEHEFPCFVKPRYISMRGTPAQYFRALEEPADLEHAAWKLRGREELYVVQPLLGGTEYNIDFFCDIGSEVVSIVPLQRLGMGSSRGINRGAIVEDERFDEAVHRVAAELRLVGANQLQAFVGPDSELAYTELNPRLSGSSVFVREAGADFFAATVALIQGRPVELPPRARPLRMSAWEEPFFYDESPILDVGEWPDDSDRGPADDG